MPDVMAALIRARQYEQEINVQLEHIERLHRIAARARESSAYSAEIVEKLAGLERELNRQIDRTVDAKREALEYISILTGEERSVIEGYYILAKSWQKIAQTQYMSERRVFLLRKSALEKLAEHFGQPERRSYGNRKKTEGAAGALPHDTRGAGRAAGRNSIGGGQL